MSVIAYHDLSELPPEPAASFLTRIVATSLLDGPEVKEAMLGLLGLLVPAGTKLGPEDPLPIKPGAN